MPQAAGTFAKYVELYWQIDNMVLKLKMAKKQLVCGLMLIIMTAYLAGCARQPQSGEVATQPSPAALQSAGEKRDGKIRVRPDGVPVLMYHSVGPEAGNDAVISSQRFAEHMEYLHRHHYRPISLDELYAYLAEGGDLPPKPAVITFDDGYRDTYLTALPILKKYEFKSVVFVPVSEVGRNLSWDELREMKAAGMDIAAHSYTHRELQLMSPQEQAEEISKSKELLDRFLGQNTRFFCYPYGTYNNDTIQILKDKGFVLAVTIDPGWAKPGDNPFALRRVWMGNSVDLKHFEERLTRENYSIL